MNRQWIATTGLAGLLIGSGLLSTGAIAQSANTGIPKAKISADRTRLKLRWDDQRFIINAADLNVQVLDAVDCEAAQIADQQTLNGQWFFPGSVSVDPVTGNVAVGVLLQECYETQTSAVFVFDPQPGAYAIYRVQVPGNRPLPDEFSTFPLSSITGTGFVGGDLVIKHADVSDSEALMVFTASTTPAGEYAGCLLTRLGGSDRLCPDTP
ncbi:MAG: hypothetical protein IGR76_09975 [Synechococcales cyanobacterium T60_A2020_003]|nr:hypothetical protein [Synechococcales cyanobacterium T60_A2020_003]